MVELVKLQLLRENRCVYSIKIGIEHKRKNQYVIPGGNDVDYRAVWEEHAGLIFDEIHKTQIKETSEYSRTKNVIAVGLIGVSFLDGPAPIMDAIAVIGWELLLGD